MFERNLENIMVNSLTDFNVLFYFHVERKYPQALGNHIDKKTSTEKVLSTLANEAAREAIGAHRNATTSSAGTVSSAYSNTTTAAPAISYSLGRLCSPASCL